MSKLLVLGAGPLQVPVIRRAKAMGIQTIAADGNSKAVGLEVADAHVVCDITSTPTIVEVARKNGIDGVVTAATDHCVVPAAEVAERLNLAGIPADVARLVKDKGAVREVLAINSMGNKPGVVIKNVEDALQYVDTGDYPLMVKPTDGSGSAGISRIDSRHELALACQVALKASRRGSALIEPFINGVEYGVESFVQQGHVYVLAIMLKKMTQPPVFAELGHTASVDRGLAHRISETARNAIAALGITNGAVNMDILVGPAGAEIIDVGARMGGNLIGSHIVPLHTGVDHVGNIVRNALGETLVFPPERLNEPVASRILALAPGRVLRLPDISAIEREYEVEIVHSLFEGRTISSYRTNRDGCGWIVAAGASAGDCELRAGAALEAIDREILRADMDHTTGACGELR